MLCCGAALSSSWERLAAALHREAGLFVVSQNLMELPVCLCVCVCIFLWLCAGGVRLAAQIDTGKFA